MPDTRIVTTTLKHADGSYWEFGTVLYRLREDSYTTDATYPRDIISATADELGTASAPLWPNAGGLVQSHYDFTLPDGTTGEFVLPDGDSPITLEELRAARGYSGWAPTTVSTFLDILRSDLANNTNIALGDAMIGFRGGGVGAGPRTVHDKLAEWSTVKDFGAMGDGVTDDTEAFQSATDALIAGETATKTLYIPAGEYVFASNQPTNFFTRSWLMLEADGLAIKADPGSSILIRDGAANRPIIVRNSSRVTIEGLTILDERSDRENGQRPPGSGLVLENTTQATVRDCRIENFFSYGIALSENTDIFAVQSSLISFDAGTQQIRGPIGMFSTFVEGSRVFVIASVSNNGFATAVDVAADGSSITIDQVEDGDLVIVDEMQGASGDSLTDTSISFDGHTVSVVNGVLYFFGEDDRMQVTGSASNNNTFTIEDVAVDGLSATVTEEFVHEDAGASITLSLVGRPFVQMWDARECNDILIENNIIVDIDRIGLEIFAKKLSTNLKILNNTVTRCGLEYTAGSGIKAGTNFTSAQIRANLVQGCQMGLNLGNFRATTVEGNQVTNCEKYAIAITCSTHVKAPLTAFGSLIVKNNVITFTTDQETGELFVPINPNNPAININGLITDIGLLEIAGNTISRWGAGGAGYGTGGIQINKSYGPYSNIIIHDNLLIDSGGFYTGPLSGFYATTTPGSAVLTAIYNSGNGRSSTAAWVEGAELAGLTIPAGNKISDINVGANTMTMDHAVSATPLTFTATTLSGSKVLTSLSSTVPIDPLFMTRVAFIGSAVSGTGIPVGATIAAVPVTTTANTTSGSSAIGELGSILGFPVGSTITGAGIPVSTTVTATSLTTTGTLVSGNDTITSVASTVGFPVGATITGIGIRANTTILSTTATTITMDKTATTGGSGVTITRPNTLILSANATATATGVTVTQAQYLLSANATAPGTITVTCTTCRISIRTGLPYKTIVKNNYFISTESGTSNLVRLWSNGGRVVGNTVRGFGSSPIQVLGTTAWIVENTVIEMNQDGAANRGPFLLGVVGEGGTYYVLSNLLDLSTGGAAAFLVNSTNATTWYTDGNNRSTASVTLINSGGVAATTITKL